MASIWTGKSCWQCLPPFSCFPFFRFPREFPALRSGLREDRRNFVLLLEELRSRADEVWRTRRRGKRKGVKSNGKKNPGSSKKGRSNFIISVAVGAPLIIASTSYIIPALAK